MTAFPWGEAMGFGLGVLRLSPDAFWRMTPRELAAAHAALAGRRVVAPGRDAMAAMMARFPDEGHGVQNSTRPLLPLNGRVGEAVASGPAEKTC